MCLLYVFGDSTDNLRYIFVVWHCKDVRWLICGGSFCKVTWHFPQSLSCWVVLNPRTKGPLFPPPCIAFPGNLTIQLSCNWISLTHIVSFLVLFPAHQVKHWSILTSNFPCCQRTTNQWQVGVLRVDLARLFRKDLVDRRYEPFKDFQSQVFYFQFLEVKCE